MKWLLVILICSVACIAQSQLSEQIITPKSNHNMIQGTWHFDYTSDDFSQELIFIGNGSFTMTSAKQDEDTVVQKGTYVVKDNMLTLNFSDGASQVNTIKLLNNNELTFVFIETIYNYTRSNKGN